MRELMIENERDTPKALPGGLTAEGYGADPAGNGADGLRKATENPCRYR